MVAVESASSGPSSGRHRVLDAAAELFVAQGYAGTTLRQIAGLAGIKAGSVYHHFESKEALFVAVLEEGMLVMTSAFDAAAEGRAADGRSGPATEQAGTPEVVLAHVRAHLGAVFENGPYTTAHVTSFYSAPQTVRTQVVPLRDSYEKQWQTLLAGLFPALDDQALRLHRLILFGAMNASAEWFQPRGDLSLDELAATISDQFLNGVPSP